MNKCKYCHAPIEEGENDCRSMYANLNAREYSDPEYTKVNLLTVDAHALQHPELHGKKNNAYHLLACVGY